MACFKFSKTWVIEPELEDSSSKILITMLDRMVYIPEGHCPTTP